MMTTPFPSPQALRRAIRARQFSGQTAGQCRGFTQANLAVLSARYATEIKAGEVPVFWACGVTPQSAIRAAKPPVSITHKPGCMLVTDVRNIDLAVAA